MIQIIDPGRHTSIQDLGRDGFERLGVPAGGAADWFSARVANRLLDNPDAAALLEFTSTGPTLTFDEAASIALTGAGCAGLDGSVFPAWQAHEIPGKTTLALGRLDPGFRGYLAICGGIRTPVVLGSRSLCQRGNFGGGFGRPLRPGDAIPIEPVAHLAPRKTIWPRSHRLPLRGPWEVRVLGGPHSDAFPADALMRLEATACVITPAVDRMGLRIDTPGFRLRADEILTTPVTTGAIQVTPSGQLIALLVDHPTTGGYPVIATVITADIPLLAQARPGDTIRFRQVDPPAAASALRRLTDWLDDR